MRRTRLVVGTALVVAGALALSACGSNSNNNSSNTSSSTTSGAPTSGSSSAAAGGSCQSGTLKADGSTAQQNAMAQWIKDYQTQCPGATITYGGGGSGQGVTDFTSGVVNFAGSDAALDTVPGQFAAAAKACASGGSAIDLPMVTGPIAIAYNLSGVSGLTLSADVLAKIFTGKITKWNDPAIAAINSGVNLPSATITVFNRSDASGTTQNFESYLAASAPTVWTTKPSKQWAGVGQGKSGNPLVGQAVQSTKNSIAYVEWSYALQNNLPMAKIDNGGGAVALTADTVATTVSTAAVSPAGPGDLTLKLNYATKTPGAYPIILVTYEIACTQYSDASTAALVKSFLTFISSSAEQNAIHSLGYAALPSAVASQVQSEIAKIS